jgi:hypothetical protein
MVQKFCDQGRKTTFATLSANSGLIQCSKRASLFNQLVGKREQLCWNFEAECLRGLHIDQQLELGRRLHRQVGRLARQKSARFRRLNSKRIGV